MALHHAGSTLPVDVQGYRFWADFTAAQARNTGRPSQAIDRRVRRFFNDVCRAVDPTLVLELGAHEGRFSVWAKESFPQARCLALEANPYVHSKHQARLREAGVEYVHLAAADANGTVTINIPTQVYSRSKDPEDSKMGSLGVHTGASEYTSVDVQAVRVDDYVDVRDDDRVVAWIDVEGASEQVLTGAREVLARTDATYIEVEREEVWPGQWLELDVARFFQGIGKTPAMRDIQRKHQYNVVFVGERLAADEQVAERAASVLRPPRPAQDQQPSS
jgi:FkbM family methyltransferase